MASLNWELNNKDAFNYKFKYIECYSKFEYCIFNKIKNKMLIGYAIGYTYV